MQAYRSFGKYTVFITRNIINKVMKVAGIKSMANYYISNPNIPMDKVLDNLILETLSNQYNTYNEEFYNKWVKFEVDGEEAKEDVLNYLDAYCRYYKNAYLVSENGSFIIETKSLIYSNYESYNGTKFYISFQGEKRKVNIFKQKNTILRTLVDINKVIKIVGDYKYFEIIVDNGCKLSFSEDNFIINI